MILSPTELALVNIDGLVRTTNLNRAALQKHQHGFPAEHAPVRHDLQSWALRWRRAAVIRGSVISVLFGSGKRGKHPANE